MRIPLDPAAADPIYEQIRTGITAAILGGELTAGESLPSIRSLARDLRVSVITTTRAYNELVSDGMVYPVQGKGVFVQAQDPVVIRERAEARIAAALTEAARAGDLAGITRAELHEMLDAHLDERGSA